MSTPLPTPTTHSEPAGGGLRALARRTPLVLPPETTLRTLLTRISQGNEDAAVIASADGLPLGLVTVRELLHVLAHGDASLDEPVALWMTGAPLTLPADASVHRARVLMAKRRIHHLLLADGDGRLVGLVDHADLLGMRDDDAEALIAQIAAARDVDAMARAADQVRRRGADLFADGLAVEALCQWMSGLNDLICMRICELIENEFDLPAVPWCWLAFGSEGRLEQTFATDQDNGLLFVPPTPAATDATRAGFLPFAQAVNEALHRCGFDRCEGGIMAGNPLWCMSADEWQRRFRDWLKLPEPEALVNGTIFFDLRPLYGNFEPVDRLRGWLAEEAPRHDRFFHLLARQTLDVSPPLGWAGQFAYERNKDFPHTIDLKLQGARLFTDVARIWALQTGTWATGTVERLRATELARERPASDTAAEIEAFHLIQRFRIQQQLQTRDRDAANRVDPDDLNELHRLMLKEALRQAKRLQMRLRQQFGL